TQEVRFSGSDLTAACGGTATGILDSGASDELTSSWVSMTKGFCAASKQGLPTRAAFLGEGAAVTQFATGQIDLAYTAAGYRSDTGLTTVPPDQRRDTVAIPVGLGAGVIAMGGGAKQLVDGLAIGDKAPYPDGSISLTKQEFSTLLGGGVERLAS